LTTNIIDHKAKQVCSDSRWSGLIDWKGDKYLLFVDDTNFHKLEHSDKAVIVMAGDAELIGHWKKWWQNPELDRLPDVTLEDNREIVITIVHKKDNRVIFDIGSKHAMYDSEQEINTAIFAGSGGIHAANFWGIVPCAIRAVESAAEHDPFTGGNVMYVDYNIDKSNLTDESNNVQEINNALVERGMIMKVEIKDSVTSVAIPITEHEAHTEIVQSISSGQINPSAPVSTIRKAEWTDERKEKLAEAIRLVFP
jgi:hypothetical protein